MASGVYTIDLTKSETVVVEEQQTLTQEEVDKRAKACWYDRLIAADSSPSDFTSIPFECEGKTYSFQYHEPSNEVFMYEPMRAVYGDQIAVEWLFKHYHGFGVETPPHCVDWYLVNVMEPTSRTSHLDRARPTNLYSVFVKKHGSIQNVIQNYCVSPEVARRKANQIFHETLEVSFEALRQRCEHSPAALNDALKLRLQQAIDSIFEASSSAKRSRST